MPKTAIDYSETFPLEQCPHCHSKSFRVNKYPNYQSRFHQFYCRDCKKTWTESGRKPGDRAIGDRAMTQRENQLKHVGRKTHYQVPNEPNGYTACGQGAKRSDIKTKITSDKSKVTCKFCQQTKVYNSVK